MSKIAVSPNGSGTGTYTLASPNNNASHTITLPVATGELLVNTSTGVSVTGDLSFGDSDKIVMGASSDLEIYHDGTHSYVSDQGTGNIKYRAASRHQFENADGSKMYIQLVGDTVGQEYVQLRHNNATKLATTSTGIDVTGTVAATAFAGDGSGLTGIAGIPSGAVIYHAANTAPTGFIKANGASISTSTYSDLFAVIGYTFGGSGGSFNVPDLRGEFIRCWDGSRGVDSGRALGSSQGDLFKSHSHTFGVWQATTNTAHNGAGTGSTHYQSTQSVSSVGGTETRPRNIALLACIKY